MRPVCQSNELVLERIGQIDYVSPGLNCSHVCIGVQVRVAGRRRLLRVARARSKDREAKRRDERGLLGSRRSGAISYPLGWYELVHGFAPRRITSETL